MHFPHCGNHRVLLKFKMYVKAHKLFTTIYSQVCNITYWMKQWRHMVVLHLTSKWEMHKMGFTVVFMKSQSLFAYCSSTCFYLRLVGVVTVCLFSLANIFKYILSAVVFLPTQEQKNKWVVAAIFTLVKSTRALTMRNNYPKSLQRFVVKKRDSVMKEQDELNHIWMLLSVFLFFPMHADLRSGHHPTQNNISWLHMAASFFDKCHIIQHIFQFLANKLTWWNFSSGRWGWALAS